ncbi:plasmid replication protein RepC [Rhizobium sp. ICMP 5592]|uniref:plasmid replication protein RepC n=1 Tax=Rhizobium sp. ICMP 5592 TaxID=2292445 RepID=UPI001297E42D|nr:plasmid replication protein RepC [Rhizobium sp. ICMP 5592]MQB46055.1 replication initiation protein RepC [Rhizobium sp. ICMP 5592]
MQVGNVTTPFGRRTMSLALIKGQMESSKIKPGKSVDKWKIYRDVCDARSLLGLRDRALSVLNALLSFYPESNLVDGTKLVVFPSNAQLATRANGIAGTTLRENLAILVNAGMIHRKDSPNGKRYARKDRAGTVEEAFGFNLAPLLARSEELARLAQQVAAERKQLKVVKERISLCRRDIRKILTAAMEEGASGDWGKIEAHFVGLISQISKARTPEALIDILDELSMLREEMINTLENQLISENSDSNDDENRHHIQNSKTESIYESEPRSEKEQGVKSNQAIRQTNEPIKAFPLGLVLRACPDVAMYAPSGTINSWRELMSAAITVRSMLGVSPSAYQDACDVLGPEMAAAAIACILERGGHINSAGGYLRDLTRRAEEGKFSIGPMLMALIRANISTDRKAG